LLSFIDFSFSPFINGIILLVRSIDKTLFFGIWFGLGLGSQVFVRVGSMLIQDLLS